MKKILLLTLMCLMATGGFAELVVLNRLQSGSTKTLHDGDVVTGKLLTNVKLKIADGASECNYRPGFP